ncbi:hypothetical protein [Novosphingobium sp. BW1]|uniref:hypothetical protein n=1 Tax=Novosphingobium sp. BW1 TaxID=2592621 RepID=UPI0011DEC7B7|nr:hypothetical protein [Novosphingobium sp. BW1]TYC81546.1 hypothetical protein FMM79_19720 [Novosphingobium sp. BW1]
MHRGAAWISIAEYAVLAGISEQAARKRIRIALQTSTAPQVRELHGRGGRSGTRYEVLLSSLSEPLQRAFMASSEADDMCTTIAHVYGSPPTPAPFRPSMLENQDYAPEALEAYERIEPALQHPPRSAARRAAVATIAKQAKCSVRTIERKIKLFEDHGLSGLVRKKHADAHQRRVYVSKAFDRAYVEAGYDLSLLPKLSDELDLLIKSFWATRAADAGTPDICRGVAWELAKECRKHGIQGEGGACRDQG